MRDTSIWSLHDVCPDSFDLAETIVERLSVAGVHPLCILIIPSGDWAPRQLDALRRWERDGHTLAGHGWSHRSAPPRTIHHRLHSFFFSRDAAEHLGRTNAELQEIIQLGARWFASVGLTAPALYVPPAWAIGELPLRSFSETPYRWVETLTGIYSVRAHRFTRLPLVGFEADTRFRARALRGLNGMNRLVARAAGRPIRIAIHPHDFELLLADDLAQLVRGAHRVVSLASLDRA